MSISGQCPLHFLTLPKLLSLKSAVLSLVSQSLYLKFPIIPWPFSLIYEEDAICILLYFLFVTLCLTQPLYRDDVVK